MLFMLMLETPSKMISKNALNNPCDELPELVNPSYQRDPLPLWFDTLPESVPRPAKRRLIRITTGTGDEN